MKIKDVHIRNVLHDFIENKFSYDKTTRVIDELQVCYGEARVDVAAINGAFYGYEIKSESDTLERLPNQANQYSKVFDYISLVCSSKFIEHSQDIIPEWWGIYIATTDSENNVSLHCFREPVANSGVDSFSLAQFLWKDELVEILLNLGFDNKVKRLPKYKLWNLLADTCPINDLKSYVRTCLKQRKSWRVD